MTSSKECVRRFKELYGQLNHETCTSGIIEKVYEQDMLFIDSFHQINGVESFVEYCDSLYENLRYCEFEFHKEWIGEKDAMLTWTMSFSHPRLNGGRNIDVEGASELQFGDFGIIRHQDYFDGGNLLYEHVPVLGMVISQLKKRLSV